jgi:hypothetical protein
MNKYIYALIAGSFLFLQPLHAGGPWLVYKYTVASKSQLLVLNLGYDDGPQFAFTESDPDEEVWLEFSSKQKRIWKHNYDGDGTSDSTQNEWHRLSWGRDGNKFGLLYSQYEVVGDQGTSDHGVFFGTGTCVAWPNKGKSIGVTGKYPQTLKFQILRLDGGWNGSALGTGSRQLRQINWTGTLDILLTKDLNDASDTLSTNLEAKDWIISYFVNKLGYTQGPDVTED